MTPPERRALPAESDEGPPGPLLTVGIATYNRSHFLGDMVRSVCSQADQLDLAGEVEVVVSDNASTDDTRSVVERLQAETAVRIRYHVNDSNIGPGRNVARTLELARGLYWMFYGDDDLMADGALPAILEGLRGHPDASAFVFSQAGSDDLPGGAAAERELTVPEVARDLFYYLGNAGVTALKVADAQGQLRRLGVDQFQTWWPVTNLAFMAMAVGESRRPCVVMGFASSRSPHHAENTAYTSWYVWETTFHSLLQTAEELRPVVGDSFFDAARGHLFSPRRILALARWLMFFTTLVDLPTDLRLSRQVTHQALRMATPRTALPLLLLWCIVGMPTELKSVAIRAWLLMREGRRAPAHWARLRMRAAEHRARRAAAQAGGGQIRLYAPEDV